MKTQALKLLIISASLALPLIGAYASTQKIPPSVSLSASHISVIHGGASTLTWTSANAKTCKASGGWSGQVAPSGSRTLLRLTSAKTYGLTCAGAGGSTAKSAVSILVEPPPPPGNTPVGINLVGISDWGDRQMTFVDVMKQARGFANINMPWDPSANPPPLDANGWPTTDFGVYFITNSYDPLGRPLTATFPSMFGTYSLSFNGQANLRSNNGNQILNQAYDANSNTTTAQVVVGPANSALDLEFYNTHGGVQNLKLLRPGYAPGSNQVFTTQFLNAVQPFSVLRCMELLNANGNPATHWANRKSALDPTQQDARGIAWEYVIALANQAHKDIWINIPAGVDLTDPSANNYVIQLASLLKASLNPLLNVYVEYSNEVWNSDFSQNAANLNAAINEVNNGADPSLNYDHADNKWYWGFRRVAHQLVRISQLFAQVYGDAAINTTIRPVFAFQAAQPFLTEDVLRYVNRNFGPPCVFFYAIAGAPYFSAAGNDATLDDLFANLQTGLNLDMHGFSGLPAYRGGVQWNNVTFKSLANYYNLKSFTYEGGPDLSQEKNTALAEQGLSDPRMSRLIQDELADFYGCGNDLFMYYVLATPQGDAFGVYEDLSLPTAKSQALTTVTNTPLADYKVCTPAVNNRLLVQ